MSTNDLTSPPDSTVASAFAEGQTLAGCYVLSRRLAADAGREVWLASDDVLGKDVTLHLLPLAVTADNRALQELRTEIKRHRQLIHPHILRVYDLIEEPEWAAISMNAFEGESLALRRDHQPEKRFTATEIEPWVFTLLQTIEDAHKVHFLHRDLAPDNIFLTAAGDPLVANFAISRTIQEALGRAGQSDPARLAYVSPQTLEGAAPARTDDVYALGATLYSLLVGAPPFSGGDLAEQVRAGVSPGALSALAKGELHLPPAWQKGIAASLQKSPEARPQSAAELLKILKGEVEAPAVAIPEAVAAVVPPAAAPAPVVEAPAEPAPVANIEVAPPAVLPVIESPVAAPVVEEPAPRVEAVVKSPATAERLESVPGPEPEIEIIESKALEELSKFDKEPVPAKPEVKVEAKAQSAPVEKSTPPVTPPPEPKKPVERVLTDFKPRLYPEESRFPTVAIGIAAAVLIGLIAYFLFGGKKPASPSGGGVATSESAATPAPEPTQIHNLTSTPAPPKVVGHTPAPSVTPSPADVAALDKTLADKKAALEAAKQAAADADKAYADRVKDQQAGEAALADSQKTLDEKTKAGEAARAALDEMNAQRQKLEESQKAAEAAAAEVQKLAAEKARVVEEGKKALLDLEKERGDKLAMQDKAAADLSGLQKALTEKQRQIADLSKAVTDADTARQQKAADVAKLSQELAAASAAFSVANAPGTSASVATPSPSPKSATATPVQIARLTTPAPATPGPAVLSATATPAPATPTPATPAPDLKAPAQAASTGANSLGLKFVPVGDVDFCIWLVRVKDFEVFARDVKLRSTGWENPGFKQQPDHPVVNVTWVEAMAFCKWLTEKEHKEGVLPANQYYRLPTDLEWSKAVGLSEETGKTPEARDMDVPDVYPWGTEWPPPKGAGNYTGEETGSDVAIKGYDDGYAWTSPVGSFNPNKYGLYDMGGNVWEWCMDNWNNESKAKVLRGASWYNGALKLSLLSSCRVHAAPDGSTDNYGFRIVRASESPSQVRGRFR